jgi:hypothetical protein
VAFFFFFFSPSSFFSQRFGYYSKPGRAHAIMLEQ